MTQAVTVESQRHCVVMRGEQLPGMPLPTHCLILQRRLEIQVIPAVTVSASFEVKVKHMQSDLLVRLHL